jgi:hypothetical protein
MNNKTNFRSAQTEVTELFVYPNPTSGPLTIAIRLKENSMATLDIYSTSGQMMSRILEEELEGGELRTILYNESIPEGVYYYILRTDNEVKSGKFIRVRK